MTDNPYTEVMKKKSDMEILDIVTTSKQDYKPEALEAAEIEFKKRNLSQEFISQASEELVEKHKDAHDRENASLESGQKALFLIFCWGVIPWIMAYRYLADGYNQKYYDACKYMRYGLIFWILIVVLIR